MANSAQIGAAQIGDAWIGEAPILGSANAQVSQSAVELIASLTPNAQISQSSVELIIQTTPQVLIAQSAVELIIDVAPPIPIIPGQTQGGGGKHIERSRGACRKVNRYDLLLELEAIRYRRIKFPPMTAAMPLNMANITPWEAEFGSTPSQSKRLFEAGGITTPAPAAGDVQVISVQAPYGWDGLLTAFWFNYAGLGFVQGSGDIIWRVQINQYFMRDLSNVPYTLGSPQQPLPMTQGKIVLSGQVVRVLVQVPNLSGMIQVGQSTVSAGLIGFWSRPRRSRSARGRWCRCRPASSR